MTEGTRAPKRQFRANRRSVNGWIVLDKPVGMTSTHAVAQIKRLFNAKKAGHAGTLDPLASGCLPIALGEATKTVPFVMEGRKAYRFTVSFGAETDTDDADGTVVARSDRRPARADVERLLPDFVGEISQVPPRFSALKIGGERAYDLARDGVEVELAARTVVIERLAIVDFSPEAAVFEAECGKGTYVRSIARDIGRLLGCLGHVSALRRTAVGPFTEQDAVTLEALAARAEDGTIDAALLPIDIALSGLPQVAISTGDAQRLARGQSVLLRGRDAPVAVGLVSVSAGGRLVALGEVERGEIHPRRVFEAPRRPEPAPRRDPESVLP